MVEGKVHRKRAMKVWRGRGGIALRFLYYRLWMGWVVNATLRPLYPREGAREDKGWIYFDEVGTSGGLGYIELWNVC
jgi:hypothetical protein